MHPLLPSPCRLPLFSAASSRHIEALGPAGLMERAGLAVAKLALALRQTRDPIWIACGPGNNGGDGLVAARLLAAAGVPVHLQFLGDPSDLPTDAAAAMAQVSAVPRHDTPPVRASLVIDALLGLGLNRAPGARLAEAIDTINRSTAPVLAVDLPSGLLADTGQPAGATAVHAAHTLCLLTLKPGLLTGEGRAHTGRLWFDDLGVTPTQEPDAWLLGDDAVLNLRRRATSHKGSQGQVLVVGGAPGMQGAARLAARAALRSGAGRVYLDLETTPVDGADPETPELMLRRQDAPQLFDCVTVAGCGGGAAMAGRLATVLAQVPRLVLDADALNAVAEDRSLRAQLKARHPLAATVLTPHPLEAARLLGCSVTQIQADRVATARQLSVELGCTVALKGSGTIVCSPGETPAINGSGSAALATAGTGDVLAGWIGGLWAQRTQGSAHEVACAAVHAHGRAGESTQPLRASELIDRLAAGLTI